MSENKKTNFIKEEDGTLLYYPIDNSADLKKVLEPGSYKLESRQIGFSHIPLFVPSTEQDKLVNFKAGKVTETISLVDSFLAEKTVKAYQELKIMHKLGIIMYGPPGTGKTCTATLIMRSLIEKYKVVALDCTGKNIHYIKDAVRLIRKIQDSPIVLFIDEIDNSFKAEENRWLTFLDGSDSYNNIIILGCTNHLEEIPARIKNRKSRIKHLVEIKSFPIEVYKEFIVDKVPAMKAEDLAEFSFKAEEKSLTLDQLKHAIVDHIIDGVTIQKAIENSLIEG